MRFAKTLLAGAAAASLAGSCFALEVQFDPSTTYLRGFLTGDDPMEPPGEVFIIGTESTAFARNQSGVALDTSFDLVQEPNRLRVNLATSISLSPEGNYGSVEFAGHFTITEPAYIQYFGHFTGNTPDPSAASYILAHEMTADFSEQFEYDYQYGQQPEGIAIDGVAGPNGAVEGSLASPRLLLPGTYSFFIQLAGWDEALTFDTAFTTAGNIGFTIYTELETPLPPPPADAPSIQDIIELVDALAAEGAIAPAGIAKALKSKLHYAARAENFDGVAAQVLQAFLHHVSAQTGKHIGSEAAGQMILLTLAVLEASGTP